MRNPLRTTAVLGAAALLAFVPLVGAQAATTKDAAVSAPPAEGVFVFRTANGILPTWQRSNLRLSALFPGSSLSNAKSTNTTVTLPLVAHLGSTNYAAGGFRITNDVTRTFITCASPAIDTRANVVDCVLKDGTNLTMLGIPTTTSRKNVVTWDTTTQTFRGMALRVANQRVADTLNKALGVTVFSPSVTFATAELTVTFDN